MADTGPDPAPAPAPKGILLKADTIAEPFLAEVKASLASGISRSRPPKLVGILATANAPSRSYAEFTRKQCVALGIEFELREVGAALGGGEAAGVNGSRADGEGVEEAIIEANADDAVDGLMVRALPHTFRHQRCVHDRPGVLSYFRQGTGELADRPPGCLSFTRDSRTTICSRSFRRSRMSRGSTINSTTISTTSTSLPTYVPSQTQMALPLASGISSPNPSSHPRLPSPTAPHHPKTTCRLREPSSRSYHARHWAS